MQQQRAALADERISWRTRGDGVHRRSLGDSELRTRLGEHSELAAAASIKAVLWDLRLASLLSADALVIPPYGSVGDT